MGSGAWCSLNRLGASGLVTLPAFSSRTVSTLTESFWAVAVDASLVPGTPGFSQGTGWPIGAAYVAHIAHEQRMSRLFKAKCPHKFRSS
jgi:hypothetical protein